MVWSAAVASSSLPGVFEANRLMVKDADGTERYESAVGQHFSDGSMESDLVSEDRARSQPLHRTILYGV